MCAMYVLHDRPMREDIFAFMGDLVDKEEDIVLLCTHFRLLARMKNAQTSFWLVSPWIANSLDVSSRPHLTSCGGIDVITIGVPSAPRFVAAIDPRKSDTDTAIVRLYPSGASPGGTLVPRVGDVDQDDESWFNSVASLLSGDAEVRKGG